MNLQVHASLKLDGVVLSRVSRAMGCGVVKGEQGAPWQVLKACNLGPGTSRKKVGSWKHYLDSLASYPHVSSGRLELQTRPPVDGASVSSSQQQGSDGCAGCQRGAPRL